MTNKNYCASHYLAFRFIADESMNFYDGLSHSVFKKHGGTVPVSTADDMDRIIRQKIDEFFVEGKTAVFLSGGMDSAILASYLPRGTKAFTFKCIANGAIDETKCARSYCDKFGLEHEIVEMYWSDFEELTPEILRADGVPFHSIEVQLLKACKIAKAQGIERFLIGNSADPVFGEMDKILAKDWDFDEFVARYNFCEPKNILKNSVDVQEVYEPYRLPNDKIDFQKFMLDVYAVESETSYMHAFKIAGVEYLDPYSYMHMAEPLDLHRVRKGMSKYLVRELFKKRFGYDAPEKNPMPRAMNEWLKDWAGPAREEFLPNCVKDLSGDQKWQVWCSEKFFDMWEGKSVNKKMRGGGGDNRRVIVKLPVASVSRMEVTA